MGLALASCTDGDTEPDASDDSTTTTTSAPISVTLALGHCYVEPVTIAGHPWVQRFEPGDTAIGQGGPVPPDFTGTGTITILSDTEARYEDQTGLMVPFVLDDGTLPPRECR
jgi:hypothetical protein